MRLAIVIPTLDEAEGIEPALASANQFLDRAAGDVLVVADGGSADGTVSVATAAGARVVTSEPGRGQQLRRGSDEALAAGVDGLLFLHADTRLPRAARTLTIEALARAPGGGFTVAFEPSSSGLRLGERLVNLRTRGLQIPLGDQAQFCSASALRAIGGFPAWPILEDLELIRRLRRLGKLVILSPPVVTSARRFQRRGLLRTVTTNWLIWTLFFLGMTPQKLASLYRKVR